MISLFSLVQSLPIHVILNGNYSVGDIQTNVTSTIKETLEKNPTIKNSSL